MIKIYLIKNIINNKKYVGQTSQTINHRIRRQLSGHGELSKTLKKYGRDSFTQEILEEVKTRKEADKRESFYINKYQTLYPSGYNLQTGGVGSYKICDATREKLRESHIGKKASPEQRKNMSEAQKIAQLKPSVVADKKERMSGNKYCVGRKPWNKGLENCFGKEIKCIELDMIFPSIAEASRKLKIDGSGIAKVLSGKRNHCGGYKFEYGTLT